MIKHIVSWKLDQSYSASEKTEILNKMTLLLEGLIGKINTLKNIEVHKNSILAPEGNFDILLDSEFEDMHGLKTYASHPEHLKVVDYIKTLSLQRAAIDFEV